MENTKVNKQKFIAQYWGQKVGFHAKMKKWKIGNMIYISNIEYLELKPLADITDNHAIEFFDTLGTGLTAEFYVNKNKSEIVKGIIQTYQRNDSLCLLPAKFSDKARELGYAIDWNGLDVEAQIEYGWIKII